MSGAHKSEGDLSMWSFNRLKQPEHVPLDHSFVSWGLELVNILYGVLLWFIFGYIPLQTVSDYSCIET